MMEQHEPKIVTREANQGHCPECQAPDGVWCSHSVLTARFAGGVFRQADEVLARLWLEEKC